MAVLLVMGAGLAMYANLLLGMLQSFLRHRIILKP